LAHSVAGINVKQSEYNFNTIDGYLFNFAANNIASTDAFDTWESNGYNLEVSGLNWTTDGVKTEDNRSLKLTSTGRLVMNNATNLFDYANSDAGMTLEVDFKVDASADNTKPIIRYGDWNYETQS
jgi:hypothetical protein